MKSNRNSNPQYKGEQGNKDEATKTVQLVSGSRQTGRRGAEDEGNAVIVFIADWNRGGV